MIKNIGILRETKMPHDRRVPIAPVNCKTIAEHFPDVRVVIQPDHRRAFSDQEYLEAGAILSENLDSCDILLGVKEVEIDKLIPEKKYLMFSHTAKMQAHNRPLLQEILKRKISLIDYEYLTAEDNTRVVAFGKWAGIVGAYNGLRAFSLYTGKSDLKPAWQCHDNNEVFLQLKDLELPGIKILITGGGRVAMGAEETLRRAGIRKLTPENFLSKEFDFPVYTQLDPWHYAERKDGFEFNLGHFFKFPDEYKSTFLPYTRHTDMYIPCHFWDPRSPAFFSREVMTLPGFRIKIIADVSCDINGPVPSTIRASTIVEPFYGYDPETGLETTPFKEKAVTVMAVDNLPGELPRDASEEFGKNLINDVFPELLGLKPGNMIERATIAQDGELTKPFRYLYDFVK